MAYSYRPVETADGPAIIDIFNYFVANSFAAYAETAVGSAFFDRFRAACAGYPFEVITTSAGEVIGFGCLHPFHIADTFRQTAELTYFILPEHTGSGLGTNMLNRFMDKAREMGIVTLLASISSENRQSIQFHKKHGFIECGRFKRVGLKQGTEFDMVWMQKFL